MKLLLCLLLPLTAAAADPQPVAVVTQVTGEVLVRHAQTWARVQAVPVNLFTGDAIATDRGRAEVHFLRDDSTLVLDVGTHLTISEAPEGAARKLLRRIEIFLGDVWFAMKRGFQGRSELVTPTAVAGLRGTAGYIRVSDAALSEFALSEGELEITHAGGSPGAVDHVSLVAGQALSARRGAAFATRVVAALPPPPKVQVPAEQLPKPGRNWRELLPANQRPPLVHKLPAAPVHPRPGQTKKGTTSKKTSPPKLPTPPRILHLAPASPEP